MPTEPTLTSPAEPGLTAPTEPGQWGVTTRGAFERRAFDGGAFQVDGGPVGDGSADEPGLTSPGEP